MLTQQQRNWCDLIADGRIRKLSDLVIIASRELYREPKQFGEPDNAHGCYQHEKDNGVTESVHINIPLVDYAAKAREFLGLIEYLSSGGLVYVSYGSDRSKLEYYSTMHSNIEPDVLRGRVLLKQFVALLGNASDLNAAGQKVFTAAPALMQFIADGYRTVDELRLDRAEKRSEHSLRIAQWTLIFSVLLGLVSILIQRCAVSEVTLISAPKIRVLVDTTDSHARP